MLINSFPVVNLIYFLYCTFLLLWFLFVSRFFLYSCSLFPLCLAIGVRSRRLFVYGSLCSTAFCLVHTYTFVLVQLLNTISLNSNVLLKHYFISYTLSYSLSCSPSSLCWLCEPLGPPLYILFTFLPHFTLPVLSVDVLLLDLKIWLNYDVCL